MQKATRALALATAMLLTAPAFATVIDTGPGPVWGGTSLEGVHAGSDQYGSIAGRFSFSSAERISSVAGWLNWTQPGSLSFSIASDAAGLPGSVLHSVTVGVPVTLPGQPDWRGASGLDWQVAGGDYWLIFSVPAGSAGVGSMPPGWVERPLHSYARDTNGTNGFQLMEAWYGMRIETSPVPEPSRLALAVLGIGFLVGVQRRPRRRGEVSDRA